MCLTAANLIRCMLALHLTSCSTEIPLSQWGPADVAVLLSVKELQWLDVFISSF